jgi:hypothetical protein
MNIDDVFKLNPLAGGHTPEQIIEMIERLPATVRPKTKSQMIGVAFMVGLAYAQGWASATINHPNTPSNASRMSAAKRRQCAERVAKQIRDAFAAAIANGDDPTVTEIGKKAGVSRATAYRAFKKSSKKPR